MFRAAFERIFTGRTCFISEAEVFMKKNERPLFTGIATALVTPFKNNKVDFEAMGRLIDRQIEGGVSAIVICGTTGEAPTLSFEEHRECIAFAAERVDGRIPVIAGSGSNSTQKAIELSVSAEDAGADALLVVTPYYNKASAEGLVRHYTAISEAVAIPLILYNVPSRTGVNIPMEVYKRLSYNEKIVAVKDASGDLSYAGRIVSTCGNGLYVYSGNDNITYEMMSLGAKGCISVASNIIPCEMSDICSDYFSNETLRAKISQDRWGELFDILFCEVNPIPLKYAMSLMGLCSEEMRLPLCEPDSLSAKKIKRTLRGYGFI